MGGVWALELDIVGYKSLSSYLLDLVTYDKLLKSLRQDFLIFKMVKNILSCRKTVTVRNKLSEIGSALSVS